MDKAQETIMACEHTVTISIDGRTFYFKAAPHLKADHEDWHNAYTEIITRFLDDLEVQNRQVQLPAFPLLSAGACQAK